MTNEFDPKLRQQNRARKRERAMEKKNLSDKERLKRYMTAFNIRDLSNDPSIKTIKRK